MIQKIAREWEIPVERLLNTQVELLDPDWVELLTQAKKLGMNKEEIKRVSNH
jgi:XRE family transcriptional regulator, master regulator for biofilm formation